MAGYNAGAVEKGGGDVFSAEDARDPEIHWRDILPSADLGLEPFHFDDVREIMRDVLRNGVEADRFAIPVV